MIGWANWQPVDLEKRLARPDPSVHWLLQSYDGQAHQMDGHRAFSWSWSHL